MTDANPREDEPHPAAIEPSRLLKACEVTRTRRSGPGGQNRNKVETAVVLAHRPTGIKAEASERRTQGENLAAALFRLRIHLAIEVRGRFSVDRGPSTLWSGRCRGGKIAVNPAHDDFPALLAEALDALAAVNDEPVEAARVLGCSTSQLVKFLKLEPEALARLNARRRARGLHSLQ